MDPRKERSDRGAVLADPAVEACEALFCSGGALTGLLARGLDSLTPRPASAGTIRLASVPLRSWSAASVRGAGGAGRDPDALRGLAGETWIVGGADARTHWSGIACSPSPSRGPQKEIALLRGAGRFADFVEVVRRCDRVCRYALECE